VRHQDDQPVRRQDDRVHGLRELLELLVWPDLDASASCPGAVDCQPAALLVEAWSRRRG
jgi:hypothetical protein